LERACGGSAGCGTCAIDSHRQTHQCGVSLGGLDPAGQHHGARAGPGYAACRAAHADIGCERAIPIALAIAAPDLDDGPHACRGQKASCSEASAPGAGRACAAIARYAAAARDRKRLILSKAFGDR
jgi:hypothetical protein